MKNRLLTIAWCTLLACAFTSCAKEEWGVQEKVRLSIRTALTDYGFASRNNLANEAMHDLRIIIQRPDGSVEHNRYYKFGSYVLESDEMVFEVVPDETKKVYLFSNSENIPSLNLADIDTKAELDAVGNFVLTSSVGTPLPMSAVHEVEVEKEDKTEQLYIVRTACKVTFEFDNQTGGTVLIGGWKLDAVADRSFLMPHINEQNWMGSMVTDAEDGEDTDSHWITDYEVPSGVANKVFEENLDLSVGSTAVTGPVYFHETKNIPSGNGQQYEVGVMINNQYHTAILPNLKSMVRNTHVKINVTITRSEVTCKVSVYPYGEVILNPSFGLSTD